MESWDHPVKMPYLIYPNQSLTWNNDLKKDIVENQFFSSVNIIKPLKFRYIYDFKRYSEAELFNMLRKEKYKKELSALSGKKYILYPTTTSSLNQFAHKGEMQLIDRLCSASANEGIDIYIKPKPNGVDGDYDIFKKNKNVIIGIYATDSNSMDLLDEEYNIYRYLLLKNAYLVVNVGTTFVLEAALADVPIVQLILREKSFDNFSIYSKNLHIEKYLHGNSCVHIGESDKISFDTQSLSKYYAYSQRLKRWVENEECFYS